MTGGPATTYAVEQVRRGARAFRVRVQTRKGPLLSTSRRAASIALAVVIALTGAMAGPASSTATLVERVDYAGYVQSVGWQPTVTSGATAGTTGRALRLEAFRLTSPALTYRAYVQGTGWQPWVPTGSVAGAPGSGLRLEAFAISAPPDARYRVEYRAHVATLGWRPWVHGARTVGTPGSGLRIEAMQVRLVEKSPPVTDPVTFAATADNGLDANARAVFAGIGRSSAQAELRAGRPRVRARQGDGVLPHGHRPGRPARRAAWSATTRTT